MSNGALFFVLLGLVQAADTQPAQTLACDELCAEGQVVEGAPAEMDVNQFRALCRGDRRATESFRRLFLDLTFEDRREPKEGTRVRYLLFVPDVSAPLESRPLVIWLHGGGAGETDERHHLACMARYFFPPPWQHDRFSFFFLSVLCPYDSPSWTAVCSNGDDMLEAVVKILDRTVQDFPVDTTRISLVGISRGGTGSWELATRYPDRFSAVAPISSRGGDVSRLPQLRGVPVWAFQSTRDKGLSIDAVRQCVHAITGAGGIAQLTEFDSDDHDAWTPAFDQFDLLNWLLSQKSGRASEFPPDTWISDLRARNRERNALAAAKKWGPWSVLPLVLVTVLLFELVRWANRLTNRRTDARKSP